MGENGEFYEISHINDLVKHGTVLYPSNFLCLSFLLYSFLISWGFLSFNYTFQCLNILSFRFYNYHSLLNDRVSKLKLY